jgi:acyl-CoA hydrolase
VVTGEVRHTASAYLTYVSLDENKKPALLPPISFESKDEIRRNCKAGERRKQRLLERKAEKEDCEK